MSLVVLDSYLGHCEQGSIMGLANSMNSVSRMLAPSIVGVSQEYMLSLLDILSALLALAAAGLVLFYPIEHRMTVPVKIRKSN